FVDNPFDDMGNADYWDINVNTNNGYPHFEDPFIVDADDEIIPNSALLTYNLKNYPNPFNPSTTIEYSLDKDNSIVSLEVYNIKGQKVKSLVNEVKEKGTHSVVWDGKNDSHKAVSSGVYFYKLEADNKLIKINKCIILK
nr:T9SS type A sorting domain-containing protein [Candidatus Cloacimonadota bacterium]